MKIEIVRARAEHLRPLAARLRQADKDEIAAMSGMSPLAALSFSYRRAAICYVALVDDQPEMILGVGDLSILTGTGAPWLVGSDFIERHPRLFLRASRHWLRQLSGRYSILRNMVDCRNTVSIRWLRWLGFTFGPPFDHRGHQFRVFEMRAEDVR